MTAAFRCAVGDYFVTTTKEKLGTLSSAAARSGFSTQWLQQTEVWERELEILGECAAAIVKCFPESCDWHFLLKYEIPRRAKRPDLVVLANDVIIVVEFKIGASSLTAADEWQVYSYALDLRDFHAESSGRKITPLLVSIGVRSSAADVPIASIDSQRSGVLPVRRIAIADGLLLATKVIEVYKATHDATGSRIDGSAWDSSQYRPTLNIIEAAEALFAGHSVANISHSFAINLESTTEVVTTAIDEAQRKHHRTICFVTGIPGAGKTLVGLKAVHDPRLRRNGRPSGVFLSGNGPLVKVVRQALIRDRVAAGDDRASAAQAVSAFISNVHVFLTEYGFRNPVAAPHENAIIFDEAQRAWDAATVRTKHGIDKSEPLLILDIMRRAPDWCVVVALVGGGQEIHNGEAGLEEWGRALNQSGESWRVMISGEALRGGESVAGHRLFTQAPCGSLSVFETPNLHLDVGVRAPRASWLGKWVNSLLSSEATPRAAAADTRTSEFPIGLTRNLDIARRWLRTFRDARQRCGLLASSGALRLRPHGLELSSAFRRGYRFADWFLGDEGDCRSSNWLEVAATEFECQGLELDWCGVCWGGDLIYSPRLKMFITRRFHGKKWMTVRNMISKQYILNKYRVLLTRARRGMVVWVPRGDPSDPTRSPEELDATAEFLMKSGLPELDMPQ